ncbi:MAG: cytidylate kinase-like family protein [Salinivirgaceae bacterium]|jgi:cytidylate kinase|nr:cytidylate kinase-like family protein [Salinivirgaceae bacterium]
MDNILHKYLSERVRKEHDQTQVKPGPVITLSREYGCYAGEIAHLLTNKLNLSVQKSDGAYQWQHIAKEILDDAAHNLKTDPGRIAHIFAARERSFVEDMAMAFANTRYVRDPQIKKLIAQVVRNYAEQGHAVIVGRAGCVLAGDIEQALHVRLVAPRKYRVQRVMTRFKMTEKEAGAHLTEYDGYRKRFMKFFRGDKPEADLFDVVLNRGTLTTDEIVNAIYFMAVEKNLV